MPPPAPKRSLLSYLRGHQAVLGTGALFLLATNALEKAIPWLLKLAVDGFTADDFDKVQEGALWVAAFALTVVVTRTLSRVFIFNVARDVEFTLRAELLSQLHRLGSSFFGSSSAGDIMSRATNDLGQVRLLLGFGSMNLVNAIVAYASAVMLMLALSPKLTLIALVPYPFFLLAMRFFVRRLFTLGQEQQKVLGKLSERAQEYLSGVRVVRAYTADAFEAERFGAANRDAVSRTMAVVSLRALMTPVLMGISSLGTVLVLWRGGLMINAGEISKGDLLAFYAYFTQLIWPTMAAGYILSVVQRGRAAYARVREVLDARPDVQEVPHPQDVAQGPGGRLGRGELAVSQLSFSYGERKILDDVSFELPEGGTLAIVGRTGTGKTTLAGLLSRLLPTPTGTVKLDGHDITQLRLHDLRKAVGYAQQEPFLFSTTVARNIGFVLEDPDSPEGMARIRAAAREAAILDELEQLPDGLDTVVGERGVQLSGGQKQRVALARSLLNGPAVLVLDDPLSAVDAKTERAILDALERAAEGRTLILITSRTAAAARCDQILVLDGGKVVERGPHRELVQRRGYYADLWKRQNLEQELATL
ncbi:MAG: Lipid export ATP-binding/permease protein MsbA [Myxococcaceae bacterium]|nr:Lipid export ATP-binding/permease protein MsbA [Myxococcaceae bacterium]